MVAAALRKPFARTLLKKLFNIHEVNEWQFTICKFTVLILSDRLWQWPKGVIAFGSAPSRQLLYSWFEASAKRRREIDAAWDTWGWLSFSKNFNAERVLSLGS